MWKLIRPSRRTCRVPSKRPSTVAVRFECEVRCAIRARRRALGVRCLPRALLWLLASGVVAKQPRVVKKGAAAGIVAKSAMLRSGPALAVVGNAQQEAVVVAAGVAAGGGGARTAAVSSARRARAFSLFRTFLNALRPGYQSSSSVLISVKDAEGDELALRDRASLDIGDEACVVCVQKPRNANLSSRVRQNDCAA